MPHDLSAVLADLNSSPLATARAQRGGRSRPGLPAGHARRARRGRRARPPGARRIRRIGRRAGSLAEACEALGAACASTAMVFLMHSVTAATIAAGGGERASDVLGAMARGDALGTLAFSERGTGAHFYAPELQRPARQRRGARHRTQELRHLRRAGATSSCSSSRARPRERPTPSCCARDQPGVELRRRVGRPRHGGQLERRRWSSTTSRSTTAARIGAAGRRDRPDLRRRRALLPRRVSPRSTWASRSPRPPRPRPTHAKAARYPDGTSARRDPDRSSTRSPTWTSPCAGRAAARAARPRALGDAGDAAALVPIMEAKVAATEAAARGHADARSR